MMRIIAKWHFSPQVRADVLKIKDEAYIVQASFVNFD
jgi:hypothetical protein